MMKWQLLVLRFAIILGVVTVAKADVAFSYRNAPNQPPTTVGNLDQINTASTPVGSTSTITLVMQNTGTVSTSLTGIGITGAGFSTTGSTATTLPIGISAGG